MSKVDIIFEIEILSLSYWNISLCNFQLPKYKNDEDYY